MTRGAQKHGGDGEERRGNERRADEHRIEREKEIKNYDSERPRRMMRRPR